MLAKDLFKDGDRAEFGARLEGVVGLGRDESGQVKTVVSNQSGVVGSRGGRDFEDEGRGLRCRLG